jgi:peptide/nickel transport system substrate-binding protein
LGDPDSLKTYFISGSPSNFLSFNNPTADALWPKQAVEPDITKRAAITQQIESAILSEHTIVPYPLMLGRRVWHSYVQGYVPNNVWIGFNFERVWLNK